ncbi:MAG: DUF2071 domain-containing protein [Planctomycetes bacterium]|nr:DUF2071 domain-containing protein [Planctomycetota bacterium]
MHPAFSQIDHRPWPLPERRWNWRQTWLDLLFAHWEVPAALLRPLIPAGLELQAFEGRHYIAVVPFRMEGVSPRGLPDLPGISAFPELNVRSYVTCRGKPGVWFFSLDAARRLAVWAARRFFHLPYYFAAMRLEEKDGVIDYHSRRRHEPRGADLEARYRPTSAPYLAEKGSLEHWLTERYCLFAASPDGQLHCGEIHHLPWPLQKAEAEFARNTMTAPFDIPLLGEPILHFARRIEVAVWSLAPVD